MSSLNFPQFGYRRWKAPVATLADLPTVANIKGDVRVTLDTLYLYIFNGTSWVIAATGDVTGPLSSVTNSIAQFADTTGRIIKYLPLGTTNQVLGMNNAATDQEYKTLSVGTSGTDFAIANAANSIVLNLPVASGTNTGKLSNTDWSTFNNKQPAGNYITALTGEVTASGPGSASATLDNAAVIGKVLTGYVSGAGTVAATDTILQAIQKLNGNTALKADIASPTFTGTVTIPTPFTLGATSVTTTGTQLNYLNASTGTTGTTNSNVVFSGSPTFTGTVTVPTPFTLGATSVTTTGTQLNYLTSATGTTGTTNTNVVFSAAPTLTGDVVQDVAKASGSAGFIIKNSAGTTVVDFGPAATTNVSFTGTVNINQLRNASDDLVINYDAAGSGADWQATIRRPSTGMSAASIITLPSATSTLATLGLNETFTGNKTFNGTVTLPASVITGAATITLPILTSTLATLGLAETFTGLKTIQNVMRFRNATETLPNIGISASADTQLIAIGSNPFDSLFGTYNSAYQGGYMLVDSRAGQELFEWIGQAASGSPASLMSLTNAGLLNLPFGQIQFPATQNSSANANTLDDYEEGTWTPTITFGGASVGLTYSTRDCSYQKIGNRVRITGYIFLSNKGSSTGTAKLNGLPFTSANSNFGLGTFSATYFNAFSGLTSVICGYVNSNSTQVFMQSGSATGTGDMGDGNFTNTSQFIFNIEYQAAN
jgi:hypothetical protein